MSILSLRTARHAEFLHQKVAGISVPEHVRERMSRASDSVAEGAANAREMLAGVAMSGQAGLRKSFQEGGDIIADGKIEVGDVAPDFTLKDQNEGDVTLSDFRGKKVVLSFHPLAWTSVCGEQMRDLEKHREDFDRLDALALGLSVESVPCKQAWAEAVGVKDIALLADFWPHGGVAQA